MDHKERSRRAVETAKALAGHHRHISKLLTRARTLARNGLLAEALVASEEAALLKRM